MDTLPIIHELGLGFSVALSWDNLGLCLVGCLIGTLVGVLPGLGPGATLAILLPVTAYLSPTGALIMLAGIYYGAQYGGSTTAILVNVPGESSSMVTCIDGYQMARNGRAGAALAIAALVSFFAGPVCTLLIALSGQPMSQLALALGAPEYFALMVLGMVSSIVFARGSLLKAVGMTLFGVGLSLIGTDPNSGVRRYTFDYIHLVDGIGFVPILLGMLGVTEIISNLEQKLTDNQTISKIGKLWPTREELRRSFMPAVRGTTIGAIFGVLPGVGATLASYASYAIEKELSSDRSRFGNGAVEGVAGPESANNASAQTTFIPMLTLGIPSGTIMALMIGALMIQGIQPGPRMMTNQPELFWGVIASMWIGNLMLLVINLPLVGIWVKFLQIPYSILFPCIVLMCAIGSYSLDNLPFDIVMVGLFAIIGYAVRKIGCEVAPLAIGYILGPMLEENFRRGMLLSYGDPLVFFESPVSLAMLLISALMVGFMTLPKLRKTKERALADSEE